MCLTLFTICLQVGVLTKQPPAYNILVTGLGGQLTSLRSARHDILRHAFGTRLKKPVIELVAMKRSFRRGWPFPLSGPPCRKGKGAVILVFPVLLHTFCGRFLSETKLLGNLLGHQSLVL